MQPSNEPACLQALPAAGPDAPALVAYRLSRWPPLQLAPAPAQRPWSAPGRAHFANRCLPLLIANQAGWLILSSHTLRVTWTGGNDPEHLRIEYLQGQAPYPAVSHFGHGILTWLIPFLFRTPPGYNLLVRGPANWPKDGVAPLEGLVETDWSPAGFTMNWKLTRPGARVLFDQDEPICMVVPQRRGELEAFRPVLRDLESDPELAREYHTWSASREQFLAGLKLPDPANGRGPSWQKHYFQGLTPTGRKAREHQVKLDLRPFVETAEPGR